MSTFTVEGKEYELDAKGFLVSSDQWDEDFARAMAPRVKIVDGLTREHWDVIALIRDVFKQTGKCPLVYEVCRMLGFRLKDLETLFPAGYLRGACRIAGITYRDGYMEETHWPPVPDTREPGPVRKIYRVDVRGFLVDPSDWDEQWAAHRAYEMKIGSGKLSDRHWRIIRYLRNTFKKAKEIPTIY
jgi:tRNA 2-thiouridine synthesizing protein E